MSLQTVLEEIRERPGTGEVISVVDPATEEQITEFKDCGEQAVNDAVACAKASFRYWTIWSLVLSSSGPLSCSWPGIVSPRSALATQLISNAMCLASNAKVRTPLKLPLVGAKSNLSAGMACTSANTSRSIELT